MSRSIAGIVFFMVLVGVLVLAGAEAAEWVLARLALAPPQSVLPLHPALALALLAYVFLMALPFCPGIEIGLALIMLLGPPVVPLVYGATVLALLLAFLAGRLVPQQALVRTFELLHLRRSRELLLRLAPLTPEERLRMIEGSLSGAGRSLLKYRYVALALALNTPGNVVIGAGGGIALAAGLSRLFSFPAFVLTVMLAVAPVPLMILTKAALE